MPTSRTRSLLGPPLSLAAWLVLWLLVARHLAGCGQASTAGEPGGCSTLPEAPSGLVASAATSSGLTLSWSAPAAGTGCTITGYRVYQGGTQVASPSGTAATLSGLSASTAYSFTVAAANAFGVGPRSATLTATTAASGTGAPTAAELLALTQACSEVSTGRYATDEGGASTIPICGLQGAVSWKADLDIDCDGKTTAVCSSSTDPSYWNETSATDSHGEFLDASVLPFVVIPLPSSRFRYADAGLQLGSVVAVIYQGQVVYGPFGDEGPAGIIGEASYAMATALGIDHDPATGGVDSGVTYIAFTGATGVVSPIEDHAKATQVGEARARQLLGR